LTAIAETRRFDHLQDGQFIGLPRTGRHRSPQKAAAAAPPTGRTVTGTRDTARGVAVLHLLGKGL